MKVCTELFTNSEISHVIDTEDKKITLKSKIKKIFSALKKSLSRTAHLVISQTACEKVFEIDASNFVIEACLYQIENEFRKSVVFQFKKLSEFKKRYEIHDKEFLAIVKALHE